MRKEKVVSVRLTKEQYEVLEWARVNIFNDDNAKTMSRFIAHVLKADIDVFSRDRHNAFKKQEATAKRRATLEAKKAANDPK